MTIRFGKKNRKWRGRTSRGWGMKKKRRGGGSRGGRGWAGRHKHKFTLVTTTGNDYFGRKGFHSLKKRDKTINIGDLERVAKGKNEIDLASLGYTKLLSRGAASKPYTVKIRKFTEKAREKIEKSGGKVVTE